jgi:hypothetical protein
MINEQFQKAILEIAGSRTESASPLDMVSRLEAYLERSKNGKIVWHPDQIATLLEICKNIDSSDNANLAWAKVENISLVGLPGKLEELREVHQAVAGDIHRFTGAYIDLKKMEGASGIFVRIGESVFLATTAHSVVGNPSGRISFVGGKSASIDGNKPQILSFAKDPEYSLRDVAFLELEPDFVEVVLGKECIPIDRVFPCGAGQTNHFTLVGGYPANEIRTRFVCPNSETKVFTMECWANKTLPTAFWNDLEESRRKPDQLLDVFIPRPRNEDFLSLGPIQQKTPGVLAEPFGMSGGGYWQSRNSEIAASLWTPQHYSLIALQSHWWASSTGTGRFLQGTQIIHWLRLIWEQKAILRPLLEAEFPNEVWSVSEREFNE